MEPQKNDSVESDFEEEESEAEDRLNRTPPFPKFREVLKEMGIAAAKKKDTNKVKKAEEISAEILSYFEEGESEVEDWLNSPNWHRTPLFQRIKKMRLENENQLAAEAIKKDTNKAKRAEEIKALTQSDLEEEEREAEDSPNWHRTPLFRRIRIMRLEREEQLVAEAKEKDADKAKKLQEIKAEIKKAKEMKKNLVKKKMLSDSDSDEDDNMLDIEAEEEVKNLVY
jgi:hypothetical protein